jgi:hypothetical protein
MENELDSGSSPGAEIGSKRSREDLIDAEEEEGEEEEQQEEQEEEEIDFFQQGDSSMEKEGEGRLCGFAFLIY